ncbi:MAG: M20/M25/M40 family metallo-hydrolase [Merismopedia sp. SIO2A8]|nr:M20/M25/M40 family metallo-hydrolase [Merismopedia sp. SIO2A8]
MTHQDKLHPHIFRTFLFVSMAIACTKVAGCRSSPVTYSPPNTSLPSAHSSSDLFAHISKSITPETVMQHVQHLAGHIGNRPLGSENERRAAQYIAQQLEQWGYTIEFQPFTTPLNTEQSRDSLNIIATRPGNHQWLVIGAHIDSISQGVGAVDNASGVAAMLETAKILSQVDSPHTLIFVGFGAEEAGRLHGSEYYVQSLQQKTNNIIAMLNIDAIGVGTYAYVHAGAIINAYEPATNNVVFTPGESWVRELAIRVANDFGHDLRTAPKEYWNGYTGWWSDHYAFVKADIPVAYFEAWDWHTPVSQPWWGQETSFGDISNTHADTLDKVVPQKVEIITEIIAGTAVEIVTNPEK